MLPEIWQGIQRLVLIESGDSETAEALNIVLRQVRQALPMVKITVLFSAKLPEVNFCLPWVDAVWQHAGVDLAATTNPELMQDLVAKLRQGHFDAAIVFSPPAHSPYPLAYLCYLAGIPHRFGQSSEFGGAVLSHWVNPGSTARTIVEHYLFLLPSIGLLSAPLTERSWVAAPAVQEVQ